MDKRVWVWASLAVLGLFVLGSLRIVDTLVAFFVLGMIPFSDQVMPSWVIFTAYPVLWMTGLFWLLGQTLYIGEIAPAPAHPVAKSRRKASARPVTKKPLRKVTKKRHVRPVTS